MSRAVLLLHGFLTDDDDFGTLYNSIEGTYDEVYRILFPGHGKTPDYTKFTVDATYGKLLASFDELSSRHDHIDVIGFSMGGALAVYLSQVREFDNLILLAPANKFINTARPFESAKFYFERIKLAITEYFQDGEQVQNIFKNTDKVKEVFNSNINTYIMNDKTSMQMAIKKLVPNYSYHTLSTFNKVIKRANESITEINNRTLVVWGKLDQLVPEESAVWIYSKCTSNDSKLVIYDDISHLMLQSQNADSVIAEITEFIK